MDYADAMKQHLKFIAAAAIVAVPATAFLLAPEIAAAYGKPGDHEVAREALRRGEILPFTRILPIVLQRVPGEVIDVDLEAHDDATRIEYEVKVLTPQGRVIEVKVDARTGQIREVEED